MKSIFLAALVALVPVAGSAEPSTVMYVPRSEHFIQHLYIHKGDIVDIALPPGESLPSNPIVADPRWSMRSFASGDTVHIALKAGGDLPDNQLLTIPSSFKTLHLLIRSGKDQSTTYTVSFFEPRVRQAIAPNRVSVAPTATPPPVPTPVPKVAVEACSSPLDIAYSVKGSDRIDVRGVCDDGKHTYVIVGNGRERAAAVLYRVDISGHEDQIANATFSQADGIHPDQWVADGVADHWALVVDTPRGHLRKELTHK